MDIDPVATLTGQNDCLIDYHSFDVPIHREVVAPFLQLQQLASHAGFDLVIASGYRDYERQLSIWNAKASGERPVMDSDGQPLSMQSLDPWQQVQAILRWSALPGASRHHWGTDLDVYDRATVPADYRVQLSPQEVSEGGPFAPLHQWLDQQILSDGSQNFFRPYQHDRGGIAPERWHLSYAPLSADFQRKLTNECLFKFIESQELALKEIVLEHWEEIYQRYIVIPDEVYPAAFQ